MHVEPAGDGGRQTVFPRLTREAVRIGAVCDNGALWRPGGCDHHI